MSLSQALNQFAQNLGRYLLALCNALEVTFTVSYEVPSTTDYANP